jgi:hypothetical protein
MTTKELYYQFHLLLNKNNENSNVNIEIPNFIILFNRESKRWLLNTIDKYNSGENILNLQEFLVVDKKVNKVETKKDKVTYSLPDDYLTITYGNNYSLAEKSNCINKLFNYFPKPNDLNSYLEDKFKRPSFNWERGLAVLSENKLIIHKNEDYNLIDTFISYYKIEKIDLEGYTNVNGNSSVTINPKISDEYLELILDKIVTEITRQFDNPKDLQIALQRETH